MANDMAGVNSRHQKKKKKKQAKISDMAAEKAAA